jgi:long-subunit fatty acid transport protein
MTTAQDWNDTLGVHAGLEFRLNPARSPRCGYAFVPSPIPDRSLSPASPESDQHNLPRAPSRSFFSNQTKKNSNP